MTGSRIVAEIRVVSSPVNRHTAEIWIDGNCVFKSPAYSDRNFAFLVAQRMTALASLYKDEAAG